VIKPRSRTASAQIPVTMGLKPNWRALTHGASSSPESSIGAPSHSSYSQKTSHKQTLSQDATSNFGTFTDENLAEDGRQPRVSSMGPKHPRQMVIIDDNSSDEDRKPQIVEQKRRAPRKRDRSQSALSPTG
jgi:hypothetical protein